MDVAGKYIRKGGKKKYSVTFTKDIAICTPVKGSKLHKEKGTIRVPLSQFNKQFKKDEKDNPGSRYALRPGALF